MHNVFVSLPSARGVHPETVWNLFNMRTALEAAGHKMHGGSLYRTPLDLARNELGTLFLDTTCGLNLLLDDDVQLPDATSIIRMIRIVEAGAAIVSAPCRMRSAGELFNIIPLTEPFELGGARVVECAWTGLGAVLVHRRVFEKLKEDLLEKGEGYRSITLKGVTTAAIFRSMMVPARQLFVEAPAEDQEYLLDDRAFSIRALDAGFRIHAAIDVATRHDGRDGCFGDELEKLQRAQRSGLVDANGKKL